MNYRYICEWLINGKWQKDGEAWPTLEDATGFGADQIDDHDWQGFRIRRFPMSAGELVKPSTKELDKAVQRRKATFKVTGARVQLDPMVLQNRRLLAGKR